MPMMSNRHCIAMVNAPTANTTRLPMPIRPQLEPGRAFRTGPMISMPPMPAATEYTASAPSRITARLRLAGREPALMPRIDATR